MRTTLGSGLAILLALNARIASAQIVLGDLCSLFTTEEIVDILGTAVEDGEPGLGAACQWFGKDEAAWVVVQVVDTTFWLDPIGTPGYEAAEGSWQRAYSHPDSEGDGARWR